MPGVSFNCPICSESSSSIVPNPKAYPEWSEENSPAFLFAALLYARAAIEHPLWEKLKPTFHDTLPLASELGTQIEDGVRSNGWNSPGSCLQSLLVARELTNLEQITRILDPRTGTLL